MSGQNGIHPNTRRLRYILRIDCNKAEQGLKTTAWTDHVLNAMAIDNPLEYARLYLNNEMQIFIDAEDSLDV